MSFRVHRGGETYAEYCKRAQRAGCEPETFRNWSVLAEVVDGTWRTKHSEWGPDVTEEQFAPAPEREIRGTVTARAFTAHCGRCGRAWSIPVEIPDFDAQQRQVLDWVAAHTCVAAGVLVVKGSPTEAEIEELRRRWSEASGGHVEIQMPGEPEVTHLGPPISERMPE